MSKLRQSQNGGVFTNQLKTLSESRSFKDTLRGGDTRETAPPETEIGTLIAPAVCLNPKIKQEEQLAQDKIDKSELEEKKEPVKKKKPRLECVE